MKYYVLALFTVVCSIFGANHAEAQQRCGYGFVAPGVIGVFPSCGRQPRWQQTPRGPVWGYRRQSRQHYGPAPLHTQQRPMHHAARAQAPVALPAPVRAPASVCPRVTDARPMQNTACRPGDMQFSWRGRPNYCMPRPASPNAYLCANTATGMLAWYTP